MKSRRPLRFKTLGARNPRINLVRVAKPSSKIFRPLLRKIMGELVRIWLMIIPLNREFNLLRPRGRVPEAKRHAACFLVLRLPLRPAPSRLQTTLRLPKIWRSMPLSLTKRFLPLPRKLEKGRRAVEYLKSTRLELSDSLVTTASASHSPKRRLWVVTLAKVIPT